MEEKIYFRDLDCYKQANEKLKKHKLMCPNRAFDLGKLPQSNQIRAEMGEFIYNRGNVLTPLSMRAEFYPYNQLCEFLLEEYPVLSTFKNIDIQKMENKCKAWLLKNGKHITQTRIATVTGKEEVIDADVIKYIKKINIFINHPNVGFDFTLDTWIIAEIPIEIMQNPTKNVVSISFEMISQKGIRDEIKKIIYIHLSQKALETVRAEMSAVNRFSRFLSNHYSDINSLKEIDRELLEEYLIYTNTEECGRKSYTKELYHLKAVFVTAGALFDRRDLQQLFYADDIGKEPARIYKVYSDKELKRLNAAIAECDEQIARAIILDQLLGTRISETLALRQDSIFIGETGKLMIKIYQIKTRKYYEKVINQDIKKLFDRACQYTNEHYGGKREYVFVADRNPDRPMQYGRIQYQIMKMVTQKDLKDDSGDNFGVGTHIWRHCYGKRLTELHVDDFTIAKLLGHSNTSTLKPYRKIGNKQLAKETKEMRNTMDNILDEIVKGW